MSYKNILVNEIVNELEKLDAAKKIWHPDLIAASICKKHESELVGDADFSRFNIYANVRAEVTKTINKLAGDNKDPDDNQLTIEGFQRLQNRYVIERNDEFVAVPIEQITIAELREKRRKFYKVGNAYIQHGDEMGKYIMDRLGVKLELLEQLPSLEGMTDEQINEAIKMLLVKTEA